MLKIKLSAIKSIPKRILSLVLSATLILGMGTVVMTNSGITADAAFFTNLVTGKFSTMLFGTIERGIAYGLNYASTVTDPDNGGDANLHSVVNIAKKIMLDPQGRKLGEIQASINKLSNQVSQMNRELSANDTYIMGLLNEMNQKLDQYEYDEYETRLSNFNTEYTELYGDIDYLVNCMNKLSECENSEDYAKQEAEFEKYYDLFVDKCMQIYKSDNGKLFDNTFFGLGVAEFADTISPYNHNSMPSGYNSFTGEFESYSDADYTNEDN